jgi:hypothetical protein
MISRKLFATCDYIGWILHNSAYYKEEEDKILYIEFSKDILIFVFSFNIFMKILREIYDWYLSFKIYVKELKQVKNKLILHNSIKVLYQKFDFKFLTVILK